MSLCSLSFGLVFILLFKCRPSGQSLYIGYNLPSCTFLQITQFIRPQIQEKRPVAYRISLHHHHGTAATATYNSSCIRRLVCYLCNWKLQSRMRMGISTDTVRRYYHAHPGIGLANIWIFMQPARFVELCVSVYVYSYSLYTTDAVLQSTIPLGFALFSGFFSLGPAEIPKGH